MARIPSWIAVEELEAPEVLAPEVAEVPSETVEAQLVEVDGLDRQLETLIDDGQELAEDTDNVEQLQETIEDTEEEGGIDETTAEVAEIATEAFCAKWGIRRQSIGKENFADSVTRVQATRVAVEGLGDAIKGLWERFLQLINSIIAKAKDMMLNFSNAGSRLQKRAVKLRSQFVAKFKGEVKLDAAELTGKWIKFCVFDDAIDSAKLIDFAKDSAAGTAIANASAAFMDCEDLLVKPEQGKIAKFYESIKNAAGKLASVFQTARPSVPAGATEVSTLALPNNGVLSLFKNEAGIFMSDYACKPEPKELKIAALDKGGIDSAIAALLVLGKDMEATIKDFRGSDEKLLKIKDIVAKAVINAKAAKRDTENKAEQELTQTALRQARQNVLNVQVLKRTVTSSRMAAGQGLIGLVEASLKAHK